MTKPDPREVLSAVQLSIAVYLGEMTREVAARNEVIVEGLETLIALQWLSRHEAYIDYHQEDVTIVLAHGNDPPDAWTGTTLLEVYREIRARYDPETP